MFTIRLFYKKIINSSNIYKKISFFVKNLFFIKIIKKDYEILKILYKDYEKRIIKKFKKLKKVLDYFKIFLILSM